PGLRTWSHSALANPSLVIKEAFALRISAARGRLQSVAKLLELSSGREMSIGIWDTLKFAAKNGHVEVFNTILKAFPQVPSASKFVEVLNEAAAGGHTDLVGCGIKEILIHHDMDERPTAFFTTLVQKSCSQAFTIAQKYISIAANNIKSPASLDEALHFGLINAATHGQSLILEFILSQDLEPRKESVFEAFKAACLGGHTALVSPLLRAIGPDIEVRAAYEGLNVCASSGNTDVFEYLVDHLSSLGKQVMLSRCLFFSTTNGHIGTVKAILGRRRTMGNDNTDITRALTIAAFRGHAEIARLLLDAGSDANAVVPRVTRYIVDYAGPDADGDATDVTALQAALVGLQQHQDLDESKQPGNRVSIDDRERVVRMLLFDYSCDSNHLGGCKEFPIIVAAEHCSERVVRWLAEAGADVNATVEGKNAVLAACRREFSGGRILECLLEAGAVVQSEDGFVDHLLSECLEYFAWILLKRAGKIDDLRDTFTDGPGAVAQILLTASPQDKLNVQHKGLSGLLQSAIILNHRACVELLLDSGVDVNVVGSYYGTALQAAANFGHVMLVQWLLDVGADPNIHGHRQTALQAAVAQNHTEVTKLLLHHGADINLLTPASHEHGVIRRLLELEMEHSELHFAFNTGFHFTAGPRQHVHPLMRAIEHGNSQVSECLLEAGASAMLQGRPRYRGVLTFDCDASPLHLACYHGHVSIIHLLLHHKADVNMRGRPHWTPLQIAAYFGHIQSVRVLIEAGADVNYSSDSQHSALSLAARGSHFEVVRELLAAKATIFEKGQNCLISACLPYYPGSSGEPQSWTRSNLSSQSERQACLIVIELILELIADTELGQRAIREVFGAVMEKRHDGQIQELLGEYLDR
ncbi:ankyrin repeat-containing domain protein, partial [Xylariomycetidae sp. FL2044]